MNDRALWKLPEYKEWVLDLGEFKSLITKIECCSMLSLLRDKKDLINVASEKEGSNGIQLSLITFYPESRI